MVKVVGVGVGRSVGITCITCHQLGSSCIFDISRRKEAGQAMDKVSRDEETLRYRCGHLLQFLETV